MVVKSSSHLWKVMLWLAAVVISSVLSYPDGGYGHDPYHKAPQPYHFDYKAADYYGGSHHHSQNFDGHKKTAAYDVYYPDGKSTLSVQEDGYDKKAEYNVYYPDGKSSLTVKLGH